MAAAMRIMSVSEAYPYLACEGVVLCEQGIVARE